MISGTILSRGFVGLIYVFDEEEYCNSGYTVITGIKHIIYRCFELTDICLHF